MRTSTHAVAATRLRGSLKFWNVAACIAWAALLLILVIRSAGGYHRTIAFINFRLAGLHWTQGENLYADWRGFVYSPFVAALFAPFAYLPPACGIVLWQLLNAGVLLGGCAALLRTIFSDRVREYGAIVYLLLIPSALGNLDIGHSNPLLIGLMMLAIAAASRQNWSSAALCVAIATALKIYPVALGLLICVVAPRQFIWRFLVALLIAAVAPFLFQHWSYVFDQYRAWVSTRTVDNRLDYPIKYAPLDLWFLIHWIAHLPFPPFLYRLLQLLGAGAAAFFCFWGKRKGWGTERLLIGLFCLAQIWMLLLGPATESYTYMLLAPALGLVLIHLFKEPGASALKAWVSFAYALQLFAMVRISFFAGFKPRWVFTAQPLSAVIFLGVCLVWLLNDAYWRDKSAPGEVRGA
jgi:hypothetical protein